MKTEQILKTKKSEMKKRLYELFNKYKVPLQDRTRMMSLTRQIHTLKKLIKKK